MKRYIFLIGFMLCLCIFSEQHENLSDMDKKEVIEEIKMHVNQFDFFVKASQCGKCQNIEFYSRNNYFDLTDHYVDIDRDKLNEFNYPNAGVFCCKQNWEVLNIHPLTSKLVSMDGLFCYELVCNKGNIYCGKYAVECELFKKDGNWEIKNN